MKYNMGAIWGRFFYFILFNFVYEIREPSPYCTHVPSVTNPFLFVSNCPARRDSLTGTMNRAIIELLKNARTLSAIQWIFYKKRGEWIWI